MSNLNSKEIFDLKQRVYYIDKQVNPFFNKQIIQIQMAMTQFNSRLRNIENKLQINNTPQQEDTQTNNTKNVSKITSKNNQKKTTGNNYSSNIRTVNLG